MAQRTEEEPTHDPPPEGGAAGDSAAEGGTDKDEASGDASSGEAKSGESKPGDASSDEPSPRIVKFANRALTFFAVLFAMNLFFAFHLHRKPAMKAIAAIGLVAMVAIRARAKPQARMSVVLAMVPLFLGLTGFEVLMARKRPRPATAAARIGKPFDARGLFEVVREMRKDDPQVVSYAIPRALLTHNVAAPPWADEALAHTVRPDWGLMIDGVQTLPFAGVSNRTTVFCNEGGYWAVYDSDEYGFNNPKGLWDKAPLDLVVIGDSYSQGACVPPDKITAAHLRKQYPKTLTLGMCANGPLMEYANVRENVVDLKPKIVLWVYYNNDLSDLNVETQSTMLMKYIEDDSFRQDLRKRQPGIDAALVKYLDDVAAQVPSWPSGLASVGLTRSSTPIFLQDLVMREQHSSVSSVIRLDWFTNAISSRLFERNFQKDEVQWDLFRKILTKTRTTVDGWGGKTYFVYLPDVFFMRPGMEHPNRKGVLDAVQASGMRLIDVHDSFMKLPDPAGYRPNYEAHFNEEGFELVAKYILAELQKDGL
ncbi:MAG: hypothetical protein R3B70_08820 [Polyangiaceae bacterium]